MNDDDHDDEFDEEINELEQDGNFFSSAWLLEGMTGSTYGHLKLVDGRLSFTIENHAVFDVPLSEIKDVVFPWYYFSGGVKFRIGAVKYRLSFVQPGNTAGGEYGIGDGRSVGKVWKSLLEGHL